MQRLLMNTLTPLGVLWYGGRLAWWRHALRELQRKNPAHRDIPEIMLRVRHYCDILGRRV